MTLYHYKNLCFNEELLLLLFLLLLLLLLFVLQYNTIAYQFCRAEEIRESVILFPESALEEGKRSGVLSSLVGNGRGEKAEGDQ